MAERVATTLNDLRYHWPQGFPRWVLEAFSPGREVLADSEVAELKAIVTMAAHLDHDAPEVPWVVGGPTWTCHTERLWMTAAPHLRHLLTGTDSDLLVADHEVVVEV